jgi:hypothetical protein
MLGVEVLFRYLKLFLEGKLLGFKLKKTAGAY